MTNKNIKIHNLIKLIKKNGVEIEVEDRGNWKDYGIFNHAEVLKYINEADGDLWDIVIPGYKRRLKPGNKYVTKKIIGILFLSSGNHKIFMKINEKRYGGCDNNKIKRDINRFIKNYWKENQLDYDYKKKLDNKSFLDMI